MHKEIVQVELEKYDELREFKRKIEEGYSFMILPLSTTTQIWYSKEESIKIIGQEYNKLEDEFHKRIKEYRDSINELKHKIKLLEIQKETKFENSNNKIEEEINKIKKMSYWQFRKWRKS